MFRQWILVADTAHARILFTHSDVKHARQLHSFENDKAHLHGMDMTTDRAGRVYQDVRSHGGSAQETDPKERVADEFARTLAQHLDAGRRRNEFDRVHLVAPPHFLGMVRSHLEPATGKMVDKTVAKDLAREATPRLLEHLEQNLV